MCFGVNVGLFTPFFFWAIRGRAKIALLMLLHRPSHANKSCYYVCVLVLVRHPADPQPIIAEGIWRGQWQPENAGEHGFGYDPHFYLPEHGCTAAQLAPAIKNQISHRAQALKILLDKIEAA